MRQVITLVCFLLIAILSSCEEDTVEQKEPPVNQAPEIEDQRFSVASSSPENMVVGVIEATDPDGSALTFAVTSKQEAEAFSVDTVTGTISVQSSDMLRAAAGTAFALTATVDDGKDSASATITIDIVADTVITTDLAIEDQSFSIDENSEKDSAVGNVLVSNPAQKNLSFSIASGNVNEAFSIDIDSGKITVSNTAALDFEIDSAYVLVVQVSDGTTQISANINIRLNDVAVEPFTTEGQITQGLATSYDQFTDYLEQVYLFDAVYANIAEAPSLNWDDVYNHRIDATNTQVAQLWTSAYQILYTLNNIVASAAEVLPSGASRDKVVGQARTMKAYLYFNLLTWYGSAPMELGIAENNATMANANELLAVIESDLGAASNELPVYKAGASSEKFTQETVQLLQARVSIYKKDWMQARAYANTLTNNEAFELSTSSNNFVVGDSEVFWGFVPKQGTAFVNTYPQGSYVPFVRLTEAFLVQAEADMEIGNFAEIITTIDTLRLRSEEAPLTQEEKSQLRESVNQQWQTEMPWGGITFATLKRLELATEQFSIEEYRLLLPIPQSVLESNPNLFQNPGY